jgi:membrane protein YqaA with SNARE-associated domain
MRLQGTPQLLRILAPHDEARTRLRRQPQGAGLLGLCGSRAGLMPQWLESVMALLALPEYGLSTLFVVSFLSATLLPMGSEPALFGLLKLNPSLFWSAIVVATAGNTLGGMLDWWMGYGAHKVVDKYSHSRVHVKALEWLERLGPKACLLAWLPLVGDPLCAVAGWLKLSFWPCAFYMMVGKFLRYVIMTAALFHIFPG